MNHEDKLESSNGSFVVETSDLTKRFKEVLAVDNLSMSVREGEIFGFLGPNGAGKTTTIKMIMGLTHPTAGDIFINGEKISDRTVDIRKNIGFLPERISFYDNLTPVQTLNFFCELKGADKTVIEPLIKEVGLEEAKDRKVGTFSKGMTQLLGVAQAMIGEPSIYILDEPMGGLDARWVKVVREKIKMLNEQGSTIIFSSHILSEVQNLCDRVAIIDQGKLVAEDTISNLSDHLHIKPRLEVEVSGLSDEIINRILELEGVESAGAKDDVLYVTSEGSTKIKVMEILQKNGLEIKDFKTVDPSLEDAFVRLITGEGE